MSKKVMEILESHEDKVHKVYPKKKQDLHPLEEEHCLWTMDFHGALGKDGVGIGTWIQSPHHQQGELPQNVILCSCKLAFDFTNN